MKMKITRGAGVATKAGMGYTAEMKCPHCAQTDGQVKIGHNSSGSQRYLCKTCRRKYTPDPTPPGYNESVRRQALQLYVDGSNLRRIGRILGVTHQTVSNWIAAHAARLPETPPVPPAPLEVNELDELYTFVGGKKTGCTSSPRSTEPHGALSVGRSPLSASGRRSKES